jgi:hypothetical protein
VKTAMRGTTNGTQTEYEEGVEIDRTKLNWGRPIPVAGRRRGVVHSGHGGRSFWAPAFGGGVWKAVELTAGDLLCVAES